MKYKAVVKLLIVFIWFFNKQVLCDGFPGEPAELSNFTLRLRRDSSGDRLTDYIDNMKRLARISNGISLESGLLDGSAPSDSVISELLRCNSLSSNTLANMDFTGVTNVLAEFEKSSTSLVSTKEVLDIENRLVLLENIRKSEEMNDFPSLPGKIEYRALLDEVLKLESKKDDITKNKPLVSRLKDYFADLELWSRSGPAEKADAARRRLGVISDDMKEAEDMSTNFDAIRQIWNNATSLRNHSRFLKVLHTEAEFRGNLTVSVSYDEKGLTTNINYEESFRSKLNDAKDAFLTIQKLIDSRDTQITQLLSYTTGFPAGNNDLKSLKDDTKNDWILKRVSDESNVLESLKVAFTLFDGLINGLTTVEKIWEPLKDQPTQTSVRFILKEQSVIVNSVLDSKKIESAIESFKKCESTRQKSGADIAQELGGLSHLVDEINEKIEKLGSLDYTDHLKDLSNLKAIVNTAANQGETDVQFVERISKAMVANQKFQEVKKALNKFQTDISVLETLAVDIPQLVTTVIQNFKKVDVYLGQVNGTFFTSFYDCVKKVEEVGGAGVKREIENLAVIRKIGESKELKEVKSVVGVIQESQSELKNVLNLAEDFKKLDSLEVLALKESMADSQQVSSQLGMAAQGLSAIKALQDFRETLNPLFTNIPVIENDAKASGLNQEHLQNILKLKNLKESISATFSGIDTFLKTLSAFEGFRKKRNTRTFKENEKILEAAAQIPDVSDDVKSMKEAMGELNQILKQKKFNNEEKILEALQSMELKFSKFGFQSASLSLEALDTFFVDFKGKLVVTLAPALSATSPEPSVVSDPAPQVKLTTSEMVTTESTPYYKQKLFIGCCAVGGFLFVVVCGIIFYYCRNKNKDLPTPSSSSTNLTSTSTGVSEGLPEEKGKPLPPPNQLSKADSNSSDESGGDQKNEALPKKKGLSKQETEKAKDDVAKKNKTATSSASADSKVSKKETKKTPRNNKIVQIDQVLMKKPSGVDLNLVDQKKKMPLVLGWVSKTVDYINGRLFANKRRCFPKQYIKEKLEILNKIWKTDFDVIRLGANKMDRIVDQLYCHYENMAKPNGFPDPYFNGNVATFEKAYILSSHPMDGSEKEGRESKNSTMVKFFAVVEQRGVGVIGQFSPFINAEEKTGIGCARYFSETVGETMKFSPYEVKNDGTTTLGAFSNPNNHIVYSLIITNESTKKVTNCDVLMFNWPTGSAPSDETAALEMLDYFAIHEGNVLLHCRTGLGPAATIFGVKLGIEKCMQGEVENFDEIMTALRKVRCGAITNEKEYAYLMYSIAAGVMRKIGVEFWNDFESLKYYCQNVIDGSYDGRDSRFNKLTCQEYQNEHAEMKKTIKKKREEFCKLNELEKSLDTAKSLSEYEEKGSVPTDGRTPSTASEVKKPAENQEKKGLSSPLPTSLKSKKSTKNNKSEKKNVKDQPQGKNENATKDGKSGKKSDKKVDAKKL